MDMSPLTPTIKNGGWVLALSNGTVFITFGSGECDWRPYHGWIFGYDATSLQRKYIYNTTPTLWEVEYGNQEAA
jgi:hypothetical protein